MHSTDKAIKEPRGEDKPHLATWQERLAVKGQLHYYNAMQTW